MCDHADHGGVDLVELVVVEAAVVNYDERIHPPFGEFTLLGDVEAICTSDGPVAPAGTAGRGVLDIRHRRTVDCATEPGPLLSTLDLEKPSQLGFRCAEFRYTRHLRLLVRPEVTRFRRGGFIIGHCQTLSGIDSLIVKLHFEADSEMAWHCKIKLTIQFHGEFSKRMD